MKSQKKKGTGYRCGHCSLNRRDWCQCIWFCCVSIIDRIAEKSSLFRGLFLSNRTVHFQHHMVSHWNNSRTGLYIRTYAYHSYISICTRLRTMIQVRVRFSVPKSKILTMCAKAIFRFVSKIKIWYPTDRNRPTQLTTRPKINSTTEPVMN